jgi:GPH family glycoside/pentoside/hexuronide:cation symporter
MEPLKQDRISGSVKLFFGAADFGLSMLTAAIQMLISTTFTLGMLICGWGLKLSGYVEGAVQTPKALFGIRFMFALLPVLLMLACVPLLLSYPVTRESHAALVKELEKRRAGI